MRIAQTSGIVPVHTAPEREYHAFPNIEARNGLQERIEVPLMLRALGITRAARVLEVGCGRGIALPVFAHRLAPSTLVGVDIDPILVGCARQRVATLGIDATVIEGDVRALPFEPESFDLIVDFGTCYHVGGGGEGAQLALREIGRVLARGGVFVHETPVAQHLAHPIRSFCRTLPWDDAPWFVRERTALLWSARRKRS
jgi:SAM-dependent methyltransferase